MQRVIAFAISEARAHVLRGDYAGAEERIRKDLSGELETHPICGVRWDGSVQIQNTNPAAVRYAFRRAHDLGARKEDTYVHWVAFEREFAEENVGQVVDDDLVKLWSNARDIAKWGVERCGETRWLCQSVAYLCTREAKTKQHLKRYIPAHALFAEGADWARRSLEATSGGRDVDSAQIYRTLTLALEGTDDVAGLRTALARVGRGGWNP